MACVRSFGLFAHDHDPALARDIQTEPATLDRSSTDGRGAIVAYQTANGLPHRRAHPGAAPAAAGRARMLIRSTIRLLIVIIFALGAPASAQPVFLALDGISGVIEQCVLRGRWGDRTKDYLAPALRSEWSLKNDDIYTVSWSGSIHDSESYERFVGATRAKIRSLLIEWPARPLVIVSHSWGTVVAYDALRNFERGGAGVPLGLPLPRNVSMLVTLGSPLEAGAIVRAAAAGCWSGDVTGEEFIRQRDLPKPSNVDYWLNFSISGDPVASSKTNARNFTRQPRLTSLLTPASYIINHREYYVNSDAASDIFNRINNYYSKNECSNRIDRNAQLPSGYGSPVNLFANDRNLLFEAVCRGGNTVEISAGHNYPQQYTYRYGYRWTGQQWQRFEFTGAQRQGEWLAGRATAELDRRQLNTAGNNWIIGYSCWQIPSGQWRCGCADKACARGLWQVQGFLLKPQSASPWDAVAGTWQGNVLQPGAQRYTTTFKVDATGPGARCGTIDYPELRCGGELRNCRMSNGAFLFDEALTYFDRVLCVANGTIRVRPRGSQLDWQWNYSSGRAGATAVLTRQ